MPEHDINSDDPMEMIWAVREKIYEETKDMSKEEFGALLREAHEANRREAAKIHLEDYEFPFLKSLAVSKSK